jgi:hypothetical protein
MKLTMEDWNRWQGWIKTIQNDLQTLVNDHIIFEEFRKILIANNDWIYQNDGEHFCDFILRSYVVRSTMTIRRHTKHKKDSSISFIKLLKQIECCTQQLTYKFYLLNFPLKDGEFEWQKSTFTKLSNDGFTVSSSIISNDIETTKKLNKNIEDFADQTLAHLDKNIYSNQIPWNELNNTIQNYNKLICKYYGFLSGVCLGTLESEVFFKWKNIFTQPLIRPTKAE